MVPGHVNDFSDDRSTVAQCLNSPVLSRAGAAVGVLCWVTVRMVRILSALGSALTAVMGWLTCPGTMSPRYRPLIYGIGYEIS